MFTTVGKSLLGYDVMRLQAAELVAVKVAHAAMPVLGPNYPDLESLDDALPQLDGLPELIETAPPTEVSFATTEEVTMTTLL